MRLTPDEKATRVADALFETDKANIHELVKATGMSRASVLAGIRWIRDTFGDEALVCDAEGYYAFAMTPSDVTDYRYRRLSFLANSAERLVRICEAGEAKFDADVNATLALESMRFAVKLLRRGMGGAGGRTLERV